MPPFKVMFIADVEADDLRAARDIATRTADRIETRATTNVRVHVIADRGDPAVTSDLAAEVLGQLNGAELNDALAAVLRRVRGVD